MDPITALTNVVTAILTYATEVRRTMSQDNRDAYDKQVNATIKFWADLFGHKLPDDHA